MNADHGATRLALNDPRCFLLTKIQRWNLPHLILLMMILDLQRLVSRKALRDQDGGMGPLTGGLNRYFYQPIGVKIRTVLAGWTTAGTTCTPSDWGPNCCICTPWMTPHQPHGSKRCGMVCCVQAPSQSAKPRQNVRSQRAHQHVLIHPVRCPVTPTRRCPLQMERTEGPKNPSRHPC